MHLRAVIEKKKFLKEIDNVELLSDEMLKDMDFYELAFYMQSLNQISLLDNDVTDFESVGEINE